MKILAQYTEITPYQTQEQWNLVEVRGEQWITQHRANQLHTWSIGEMELMYPGVLKELREIQENSDWAEKLAREYGEQSQKIEKISLGEQPTYSLSEDEIEKLYNGSKWEGMGT